MGADVWRNRHYVMMMMMMLTLPRTSYVWLFASGESNMAGSVAGWAHGRWCVIFIKSCPLISAERVQIVFLLWHHGSDFSPVISSDDSSGGRARRAATSQMMVFKLNSVSTFLLLLTRHLTLFWSHDWVIRQPTAPRRAKMQVIQSMRTQQRFS